MSSAILPPAMFDLDAAAYVEREPQPRQPRGEDLPEPMFDVDEHGELTLPLFVPAGHGVALTPYGRHHGLGPGVFGGRCCDLALYAPIESLGRCVWIYHLCSLVGEHAAHKCDRCELTW